MRASVRSWLLGALLLAAEGAALAAPEGVYLPPPPTGTGGEDVIETSSGARCRQSMNSNGAYVDVGVTASTSNENRYSYYGSLHGVIAQPERGSQALGYARVTVPLGQRPKRLDCSRLYELEIARMRREIELLRMNAE